MTIQQIRTHVQLLSYHTVNYNNLDCNYYCVILYKIEVIETKKTEYKKLVSKMYTLWY